MLAAEAVLGKIKYGMHGVVAMPKLNGVRGINQRGSLMARSLKPIDNLHTRRLFSLEEFDGLDGELVVGDFADEEVFVHSVSGVGSMAGTPDVKWYVFDKFHPSASYLDRLKLRDEVVLNARHPSVELIPYKVLHSDDELVAYSDWALTAGYEGLVLRDPKAPYKEGRSTAKEGGFMRYCPWFRSEASIVSILEGEVNNNPSKANELGFLHKSSRKANKVGSGMAGSFVVRDLKTGIEFRIPVPTDKMQKDVMMHPDKYLDRIAHYKFKPPVKKQGKPRFPQLVGWREAWDMS